MALAQPFGGLPAPTGRFPVGKVTLLREDASRLEPLDATAALRRSMVSVWYPAEPSAPQERSSEYLDVAAFKRLLGARGTRKHLRAAYSVIRPGWVTTCLMEQAPFARSLRVAPVLLFSPGQGMIRDLYTAQMEDLASHGYIVAAMDWFSGINWTGRHAKAAGNVRHTGVAVTSDIWGRMEEGRGKPKARIPAHKRGSVQAKVFGTDFVAKRWLDCVIVQRPLRYGRIVALQRHFVDSHP